MLFKIHNENLSVALTPEHGIIVGDISKPRLAGGHSATAYYQKSLRMDLSGPFAH